MPEIVPRTMLSVLCGEARRTRGRAGVARRHGGPIRPDIPGRWKSTPGDRIPGIPIQVSREENGHASMVLVPRPRGRAPPVAVRRPRPTACPTLPGPAHADLPGRPHAGLPGWV